MPSPSSIEDAKFLAGEFYPVFNESDLINLPNYHIYLKLMVDGTTSQPFGAVTLPPCQKRKGSINAVINLSREKYARPRKEVENEILFKNFQPKPIKTSHNQRILI